MCIPDNGFSFISLLGVINYAAFVHSHNMTQSIDIKAVADRYNGRMNYFLDTSCLLYILHVKDKNFETY